MSKSADLVSISGAALLIGISQPLLSYYIKTDRGPSFEVIGDRKLFRVSEILNWKREPRKPGRKSTKGEEASGKKS